ncbi:MAG: histidinol-phosphatase [Acidobacteria bacterium]|nr:MAG: histidinol-phosphatase [Acidobacteriota bacterium]
MAEARLVRVDCHIHSYRSGDSRTPLDQIETAAIDAGLGAICLTDHGTIEGALEAQSTYSSLQVIVGQECRTWAGEIIGLFLTERIPGNLQPEAVVEAIRDQGGLVYLPHPFCAMHNGLRDNFIERLLSEIDIVEVHNSKASALGNQQALEFAASADKALAAGSDAHYAQFVGNSYVEIPDFSDAKGFLSSLHSPDARIERGGYTYGDVL